MKLNSNDIRIISENIFRRLVKEGILPSYNEESYDDEDEEESMSDFEEYEKGYPNGDFNPKNVTAEDLVNFCRSFGDFFYIYDMPFRGWTLMAASTEEVRHDIIGDIMKGEIRPTHRFDWIIEKKADFEENYVAVFNVKTADEDYYVVYEQSKYR